MLVPPPLARVISAYWYFINRQQARHSAAQAPVEAAKEEDPGRMNRLVTGPSPQRPQIPKTIKITHK
eukprot:3012018-Amphidinium_carterae.1